MVPKGKVQSLSSSTYRPLIDKNISNMELIFGIGIVILFVTTWIVIACNAPTDFGGMSGVQMFDMTSRIANQSSAITTLQRENERLHRELENTYPRRYYRMNTYCHNCNPKVYAASVKEQELTDILTTSATEAKKIHDSIISRLTN